MEVKTLWKRLREMQIVFNGDCNHLTRGIGEYLGRPEEAAYLASEPRSLFLVTFPWYLYKVNEYNPPVIEQSSGKSS